MVNLSSKRMATVYCSGACGDKGGGKKGQGGVRLAIREIITRAVVRPPEFINERLLKVILKLHGRANAVSFVVAYGPTERMRDESTKRTFWAALDRVVKEMPKHEQLFVLMDANGPALRTGLNLRRFFLALSFLRSVIFPKMKYGRVPFPLGLSPFAPEMLFSRCGFGIPLPRRPVRLPFPGRIWCLLVGASLSLRFP